MKYTENYNLKKPEAEDFYNVEDFNENADIIDGELKNLEDNKVDVIIILRDEVDLNTVVKSGFYRIAASQVINGPSG